MLKGIFGFLRKKPGLVSKAMPSDKDDRQEEAETGPSAGGAVESGATGDGVTGTAAKPARRRRRRKKRPEQGEAPAAGGAAGSQPWNPEDFQVEPQEGKTRFQDLELADGLLHAIADLGFSYCTPIQAEILPHTLAGSDAIGQAQTGTGKTAAFLITIITRLAAGDAEPVADQEIAAPRALILAPTRELAMQIGKEAEDLAAHSGVSVVTLFGGMDYQKQRKQFGGRKVDILVATPGRLIDFERQGVLTLGRIEILVIDEADRMLDMGFIPDVRRIVHRCPPKEGRQTLFFSATMTPEVEHLASQWTKGAVRISIEPEQVAVSTVNQIVYLATADEKYTLLYNLIVKQNLERVMVFANRRDETRRLADRLRRNGISCAMLSGEVAQNTRIQTLDRFRNGEIRVLVATDVAGRGIHVDNVSHVVNYTVPYDAEDYVHRIGRTGRAGALGTSITFACEEGSFYLPEIEKLLGTKLECVFPEEELLEPPPRPAPPSREESEGEQRRGRPVRGDGRRRRSGGPSRR
ncbi:MAG: DEAD/DEAH box helicase [Thermodesulfobacteriota bacterium]